MGGVTSVGAAVVVQLDNPGPIVGGSPVAGRVFLSVEKPSVTADYLNVRFFGQEESRVDYSVSVPDGDGGTRQEHRVAYEKRLIISQDCGLAQFPGAVQQGRYEFPFIFNMPFGLPGKQGRRLNQSYYVVEYFLEVRLLRKGFLAIDLQNSIEVFIIDPPSPIKVPSFIPPVTRPLYFCLCFFSGTVTVLANVDDTNINSGELFNIDYSIHNESDSTIKALEVRVIQSMRISAQGHTDFINQTLFHHRIDSTQLQGIDKMPKTQEGAPKPDFAVIFQQLHAQMRRLTINFPMSRSSMKGQLGSVVHTLNVRVATPFCVDDPEIVIPLTVINGPGEFNGIQPAVGVAYQRPADWVAQQAPVVQLHGQVMTAEMPQPPQQQQQGGMAMMPQQPQYGQPQQGYGQQQVVTQQPGWGAPAPMAGYNTVVPYGGPQQQQQQPYGAPIPAVAGPSPTNPGATSQPVAAVPYPGSDPSQQQQQQPGAPVAQAPGALGATGNGVDSLIQQLRNGNQFTESMVLKDWLAINDARKISPEQMAAIFQCIRGEYSYALFPEEIGKSADSQLSVKHVAAAAKVVPESAKGRVCTSFAPFVMDKANAQSEFSSIGMTEYALMVVYMYYK